jgi:hypothetical protein
MPVITGGNVLPGNGLSTPFLNAGAPTNNVTQLGNAVVGSLLIDTTGGKLYICTATNGTSTVTWVSVGSQT